MSDINHASKKLSRLDIKNLLATQLGVEASDIGDEDSLTDDLQMKATDLTDFLEILENRGINTSSIDMREIETVSELIDALNEDDY